MDLETIKPYLIITAGFLIAAGVGYSIGNIAFDGSNTSNVFSEDLNQTVDSESPVVNLEFDGRTMQILHENQQRGKFFIEVTGDNTPDREINITRDGGIHRKNILATVEEKTYKLTIEYRDNSTISDDAYMKFTHVEALE